jgi:Holliday junction resolvasome RuvABC endonuclease subunit
MNHLRKQVRENLDLILEGTILAIDPASIRLGYAVAEAGEITDQGVIELDRKAPIQTRLQAVVDTLREDREYDVLAVEMIRGKMAHVYLKFSVGAVIGGAKTKVCIEMPINAWKAVAGKDHKKSDDADAVMIAKTLILLAREIREDKKWYHYLGIR